MNFFKWLLAIIAVIIIAFSTFLFVMRFHDGPVEIFSGGPFKTGNLVTGPEPDWSELKDIATIQLQSLEPPRSRTLWLVVIDNRAFIPSQFMNSKFGRIWKQWPRHAEQDSRALMRIDDKIYKQEMIRLPGDHQLVPKIAAALTEKYPTEVTVEEVMANDTWLFELAPRNP